MTITAMQCTLQYCAETDTDRLLWHWRLLELRKRQLCKNLRAICNSQLAVKYLNLDLTLKLIWEELERRTEAQLPDGLIPYLIDKGHSFTIMGL